MINRQEKNARLRRTKGIPGYVPAAPVARHIRHLQTAQWTQSDIAMASHVDRRTIHGLIKGERPQVQRPVAAAILALNPDEPPVRVPAIGTARRVQALAAVGWTLTQTARDARLPMSFVRDLATGRYQRVPREAADAVAELYRARCMTPGPSAHARTVAARNHWPSALAWDDIDDPHERPTQMRPAA